MTSRGISIDELSPELRAKVRPRQGEIELGPNSPLRRDVDADIERSLRGRRRQRAGAGFEQELESVHELYLAKRRARVRRVQPQYTWSTRKKAWVLAAGGGPCDFRGTVFGGRAVVFDAKSWEHASYSHDEAQLHQVREILEEQDFGAIAFLLIRVPPMRIAYLVRDRTSLEQLSLGKPIVLRTPIYRGRGTGKRQAHDVAGFEHRYPLLKEPSELLISQSVPRWDWLSLIQEAR